MAGWFRLLGIRLRHKAATARWLFYEFTGTEEESLRVEREAGKALADLLASDYPRDTDRSVRSYLGDMGSYLAGHVGETGYRLSFRPVLSSSVNAFALPGGFVFVTRGLMEFAEWRRDEIAFALAHEIGHVVRQHARQKLVAHAVKDGLEMLALRTQMQRTLVSLCSAYVSSEYSQDCEFEADTFATHLLINARMDPLAGCEFLRRVDRLTGGSTAAEFFRSHPPTDERIRKIESITSGDGPRP